MDASYDDGYGDDPEDYDEINPFDYSDEDIEPFTIENVPLDKVEVPLKHKMNAIALVCNLHVCIRLGDTLDHSILVSKSSPVLDPSNHASVAGFVSISVKYDLAHWKIRTIHEIRLGIQSDFQNLAREMGYAE